MQTKLWSLLLTLFCATTSSAQEWANLTGRFVYDGAPPPRKELQLSTTTRESYELPAEFKLYDESLVVDPKTKGIANIAVFAAPESAKAKMPVHPEILSALSAAHQVEILEMAFKPHLSIMHIDQTLVMSNSDVNSHVPKIDAPSPSSDSFIKVLTAKAKLEQKFATPMGRPCSLSCSIHPQLRGYLFVRDNPYHAVTDVEGKFEIKNLPVGKWRFQVWHEKSGYVVKVKIGGVDQVWSKGRPDFDIKPSGLDLGEILVSEDNFRGK